MADYPLRCHTCDLICPLPQGMVCHIAICTDPTISPEVYAVNEKLRKKRYDAGYHLLHRKKRLATSRAWQLAHPERTANIKRRCKRTEKQQADNNVRRRRKYRMDAGHRAARAADWQAYKARQADKGMVRMKMPDGSHEWVKGSAPPIKYGAPSAGEMVHANNARSGGAAQEATMNVSE
jgi:hypothetical protein